MFYLSSIFNNPDTSSDDSSCSSSTEDTSSFISGVLKNDNYYQCLLDSGVYRLYKTQLIDCYNAFLSYSPLKSDISDRYYTRAELKGLEYLLGVSSTERINQLEFPSIHLPEYGYEKHSFLIDGTSDTFIVNRLYDYIYSYIIEIALIDNTSSPHLLPGIRETRKQYRKLRMSSFHYCTKKHINSDKKCPYEWIVYTKKTSEFFLCCQRILDQNNYIDYDQNERFLGVTPISYYLVNYMCHLESNTIDDYDEWVYVPITYIDLWNCRYKEKIDSHTI